MDQKSPEAFRTISEVAEWLGVPTHVLRFWESRFSQVKPVKRAGGRRYYRPADMELLGGIRQLLHEDGMTIRGVQKLLREQGVKHVAAMSPPLDLSAGTEDVTPSNVVDLSERRSEEPETTEEPDDDTWEPEADQALSEPEADQALSEPEADDSEWPLGADDALSAQEADDGHWEAEADPDLDVDPDWVASAAHDPAEGPISYWQEDEATAPDDTNMFDSPESVAFHAHDAEPASSEGDSPADIEEPAIAADFAAPEPDPDPDLMPNAGPEAGFPPDPMDVSEAPDVDVHDDGRDAVEAEPAPPAASEPASLRMPDIGPDPDDGAYYPDRLPVAAQLRAARKSEVALPLENLWALADRLGELASRIGTDSGPRG